MPAVRPIPTVYLNYDANGALFLASAGAGQNIRLTPSTSGTVDVFNDSGAAVQLRLGSSSASYWGIGQDNTASGALLFRAGTSEKGRVLTNGRWLIGTGTDSGALVQIGTGTTTKAGGLVFGQETFLFRDQAYGLRLGDASNNAVFAIDSASGSTGILQFLRSGVEAGRIGFNGSAAFNFGVGGSTALALYKDINGSTGTLMHLLNLTAAPSVNPGGGGFLFAEAGALKWRGSSGTVTTVAPA